jgi:Family of unknown function (DUF5906)/RepB DNA-primase from phage plasmid
MTGIPAFITQAQKAALRARGLSDEDIRNIKPEEAQKILNGGGTSFESDRAEAERFLKALDPSPDARFTFQTFDDSKERKRQRAEANKLRTEENKLRKQQGKRQLPKIPDPFAKIWHGTLAEHWDELVELNAKGAGIFVTINETDGKGREGTNVTRIRAGFADLDGGPLDPITAGPIVPHIIVESSPHRFHAYWNATGVPLDQFEPLQKAIAARFDGDDIHDLPRVMRLPGFIHRKENDKPFLSHVLEINEIDPYKWKILREAFPLALEEPKPQPKPPQPSAPNDLSNQWKKLNDEAIRRYGDWVPDIFPAAHKTANGYRVTSADLGRDLEEDLSFHTGGIKDFGVHDMGDPRRGSRTPIDIVEEYGRKDFNEAVRWLAEKLGLDPNDYLPKPGTGDPAMDAEIERLAKLSDVKYDRQRLAFAKKLKVRSTTLDKLVSNAQIKLVHKKVAPAAKSLLDKMNAKNCVVLDGARTMVLRFETDERVAGGEHYVYQVPTFLAFHDFRNLYLNHIVNDGSKDPPSLGDWWLKHPQRRQYRGVVFQPGGAPIINGRLNLWTGWGVEPKQGDWSLLRKHIREALAAGDENVYQYIMNWLAWAVQHLGEQAEVALVFIGERGSGKGTLGKALSKIFGQHALHLSSPEHLTGRFNAHLRQCCFLFADEAYGPKDKSAEGTLKRLITEDTLTIEQKGRDPIEVPNLLHVMMASNNEWVVPAGAHERRFMVQRVSEAHRQDPAWFGPLYKQMREGGYAAMLFDLLERDLGDWHPRNIVRTEALTGQQEESLSALDAWWFELLQTGVLAGADEDDPDRAISTEYEEEIEEPTGWGGTRTRTVRHEGLFDQARRISPKLKAVTDAALGRYLTNEQGCKRTWVHRERGWQFPPLADCRARWLERFPDTKWDDLNLEDWTTGED